MLCYVNSETTRIARDVRQKLTLPAPRNPYQNHLKISADSFEFAWNCKQITVKKLGIHLRTQKINGIQPFFKENRRIQLPKPLQNLKIYKILKKI